MTEEDLERRARRLCEMRGLDPDAAEIRDVNGRAFSRKAKAWAADELRAWDQCRRVMEDPLYDGPSVEGLEKRASSTLTKTKGEVLQRGDRVRCRFDPRRGEVLAIAQKRDGKSVAMVEWDGVAKADVISANRLERVS